MDERELREWIARVKDGTLGRREFTRMLGALGVATPLALQALAAAGGAPPGRCKGAAIWNRLRRTEICGWDSSFWNLTHWYREA